MPARKVTTDTLSRRAIGSLSETMTTASSTTIAATTAKKEKMLERKDTDGLSLPIRKMKYRPIEINGICKTSNRISASTEASTIRSALLRRPGAGCRSCQSFCIQEDFMDEALAVITLSHDRHGSRADAEHLWIGILNANTNRKSC